MKASLVNELFRNPQQEDSPEPSEEKIAMAQADKVAYQLWIKLPFSLEFRNSLVKRQGDLLKIAMMQAAVIDEKLLRALLVEAQSIQITLQTLEKGTE